MSRVDRRWPIVHRIKRGAQVLCQLCFLLWTMVYGLWTSSAFAELLNGMDADIVLGQPNFTSNTANIGGTSARTMSSPRGVWSDGTHLFVSETGNNRMLIWNSLPGKNFAPADVVIGQPNFASSANGVSQTRIQDPFRVIVADGKVFISTERGDRVLIFNSIPKESHAPADVVVGQANFTDQASGTSQQSISNPRGISSDGTRLFIAERGNNRVLIFHAIPKSNLQAADLVLGQPDFNSNTANNGGISARSMSFARGVYFDGTRLFVTDSSNNRVLIWNSLPRENFQPADVVVGQPDFTSGTANNGGISAKTLSAPTDIFYNGQQLFVSDSVNNRVLIWKKIPTKNGTPADFVLGQPDFQTNAAGTTRSRMFTPRNVMSDGTRLYVSDSSNNRVLIFNIAESDFKNLGPQFSQGKAVVGKVFWDMNADGIQSN